MSEIRFVDTTLRDGQMSLWATGMKTGMMLPVLERLDAAGFDAIEIFANSMEKKMVRELRENPWERIDLARQRMQRTPLRMIRSRYIAAFHITPRSLERLWYDRVAAHGIRQIRTADPSNAVNGWKQKVRDARQVGIDTIINLVFSISPKHTDDYYSEKAKAAAALRPYRICLKDPGALLTPERVRTLGARILENAGGIPLEFHTHCITGLGTLCCVEAMKLGYTCINTAIPPLADGSSNPSIFSVARNARALGLKPSIDEDKLRGVEEHFRTVAKENNLAVGSPADYDAYHYIHQVPGGMISNLRHQLRSSGLADKLEAVLDEICKVRADLGYPIMVTPYSQFVGVQATMNVLSGARYEVVSDELIQYAQGAWGEEESSSIDPNVRDRILDRPRAREMGDTEAELELSLDDVRADYGPAATDDELILNYFAGAEAVKQLQTGSHASFAGKRLKLPELVKAMQNRKVQYLRFQRGNSVVLLQNNGSAASPDASNLSTRRAQTKASL